MRKGFFNWAESRRDKENDECYQGLMEWFGFSLFLRPDVYFLKQKFFGKSESFSNIFRARRPIYIHMIPRARYSLVLSRAVNSHKNKTNNKEVKKNWTPKRFKEQQSLINYLFELILSKFRTGEEENSSSILILTSTQSKHSALESSKLYIKRDPFSLHTHITCVSFV